MIVDLATYRRTGKIVPPVQLVYDDVRVEFARQVEQRLHEIERVDPVSQLLTMARVMRGDWRDSPSDTESKGTP